MLKPPKPCQPDASGEENLKHAAGCGKHGQSFPDLALSLARSLSSSPSGYLRDSVFLVRFSLGTRRRDAWRRGGTTQVASQGQAKLHG